MARQAGSVYILVDADPSGFNKSMRQLSANARSDGNEIAKNFQTAFAKPVNDAFTSLSRSFVTAKESLKWDNIKLPTEDIRALAAETGLTADRFAELSERITRNNAWEQASKNLQNIAKSANLTDAEIEALANDLGFTEDQFKRFRTELNRNEKQLKQVDAAANSFSSLVKKIAPAIISVTALRRGVDSVVTSLRDIVRTGDLATSTGLLVEDFNRLSYYAGTAGISVDQFRGSWLNFQKAFNTTTGRDAFKQLNVNFREIAQLRPEQQLRAIADAFQNIDQSSRITIAEKLFGKGGGREFIALLADGSEGLDKLADRFDKFGRQINQLDVENARQAANAIDDLSSSWNRFKENLTVKFAPEISKIFNNINDWISGTSDFQLSVAPIEDFANLSEVQLRKIQEASQNTFDELFELQNLVTNISGKRGVIKDDGWFYSEVNLLNDYAEAAQRVTAASKALANLPGGSNFVGPIQQATSNIVTDTDFSSLQNKLQRQIELLNAAGDATKLWRIEYRDLLKEAQEDPVSAGLLEKLNQLKLQQIEGEKYYQEILEENNRIIQDRQWLQRELQRIEDKERQDQQTRLQFWRQYGSTSLAAMEDINRSIEEQAEIFRQAQIDEVAIAQWASQEKLKYSTYWTAGAQRALQDYAKNAGDIARNIESAITNAFNNAEDALVEFVRTGKLNFKDFADSIISDIIRIAVRQAILAPISGGLGGLFGVGHTGGIVGSLTESKFVSPAVFANAPKFHTGGIVGGLRGLSSSEVPVIAQRGEGIFTPEQMKALGTGSKTNVNVQVINNTPAKVNIDQSYNGNGELKITAVVDDAMAQNAAKKGSNFNRTQALRNQLTRR